MGKAGAYELSAGGIDMQRGELQFSASEKMIPKPETHHFSASAKERSYRLEVGLCARMDRKTFASSTIR